MRKLTGILISFCCRFSKIRSFPKQQMFTAQAAVDAVKENTVYGVRLGAMKQIVLVNL